MQVLGIDSGRTSAWCAKYTAALLCFDVQKAPWATCTLYLACSFAGPSLLVHSVCGRLNRGLDELYTFCF